MDDEGKLFKSIEEEFNNYSKENELDIELSISLMTKLNSTISYENFDSSIELLLKKGSKKYDLLFYDVVYTKKHSPYFLDLNQNLQKDHLSLYNNKIVDQICKYNDQLYGLPLYINLSVLYSNVKLLKNYGKDIPKTWDELLTTGKYIYDKEQKKGNTKLVGYNGFIP
eukprot:jgi/Orpsp1_1/1175875/evm.model.c7180000055549.1